MQFGAQIQRQAPGALRFQHRLVLAEDGVLEEARSFSSGESKSATARRNHAMLRSSSAGQRNSAIDSRQSGTATVPASGILVRTAL
jgi:hypothetical protein